MQCFGWPLPALFRYNKKEAKEAWKKADGGQPKYYAKSILNYTLYQLCFISLKDLLLYLSCQI